MKTPLLSRRANRTAVLRSVVALLLVFGCSDPSQPTYAPAELLTGRWHWVSSTDVQTQQVHTPATEGFVAKLEFRATGPREGVFTYIRTNEEFTQGTFSIEFEDMPGNDFVVIAPSFDFLREAAWVGVGSDTLRLNGIYELGYYSRYVRMQQ